MYQQYALKWNPFTPDVPVEALYHTPKVDAFTWRVEQLCRDGGFAGVFGPPGLGKTTILRLVEERVSRLRDVVVAEIDRPQAGVADFYRELGDRFSVPLSPSNRWHGAKSLRQKWLSHIEASQIRPTILINECQASRIDVLSELRLLSTTNLDTRSLITVVFAGDRTFVERLLQKDELLPLHSRMRVRLFVEPASREDLAACLRHALEQAGNPKLMTVDLVTTLAEHASGSYRDLMNMANELLLAGSQREVRQLDQDLFLELFAPQVAPEKPTRPRDSREKGSRRR
jgi:type II secretory pathway predicted ATPase ExeA